MRFKSLWRIFFIFDQNQHDMKFKVKNEKVANDLGVKIGDTVKVPASQSDKWIRLGWGSEVVKKADKEEKAEIETKELKIENETKDATDQS